MKKISVIVPAHNEEKNILLTIENILSSFKRLNLSGEIIVINDGSQDNTEKIVNEKMEELQGILKLTSNAKKMGVGFSFWRGVELAEGEAVVMIPGDNENDAFEILRYHHLLDDVDIVVNFIFNKEIRSFLRRIFSFVYNILINLTFLTHFHYTNGTILVRKAVLKTIKHRCNGFSFQAEILIKLVKRGYLFAEVPSRLNQRKTGNSQAIKISSIVRTLKEYFILIFDIYFRERPKKGEIIKESITYQRKFGNN